MTRAASPGSDEPRRRAALTAAAIALAAAAAAAVVLYAWTFLPFISDDSLISLRYSERLLDGDGLTWNDGERVEGYSNLLWVLAVAGAAPLVGGDLVVAARVLGVLAMVSVVVALFCALWPRRPRELVAPAAGALVFAASAPIAVWAIGGLEQPLVAGLLAWSLALALPLADAGAPCPTRRVLRAGLPLALLCITRPDGALFSFAIGVGLLLARPKRWSSLRLVAVLAILPTALVAGQLVFRLAYYGEWVPNTAHAKVSMTAHHVELGFDYVTGGARSLPALPVAAVLALVLLGIRARRPRAIVLLAPGLVWAVYVALVGGDIFPAYRHLVPLIVVAAFLVAEAAAWLSSLPTRVPAGAAALVLVPLTLRGAHHHPETQRARTERWEWQGKRVGEFLHRAFAPQAPLLAVDSAGCLPFFSKLPALDLLGLNDRYLAKHPPPDFGRGWLGHELGDGAYALRRQPDLVLLCGPLGAERGCFRSGREMLAAPEFRRDYAKVLFQTPPPRSLPGKMWVRRHGRVGIRQGPELLEVPGLLFSANPRTIVRADRTGAIEAAVGPGRPARVEALHVPAGRWRVEARTTGPARVRVLRPDRSIPASPALASPALRTGSASIPAPPALASPALRTGSASILAEGAPPLELELTAPGELAIEVHAEQELGLAEVVLRAHPPGP